MPDKKQVTPHFTLAELQCHCGCGRMEIPTAFLDKLENLRVAYNKPMIITSGYRCPGHNAAVSHTGDGGPHTVGAVDIQISGPDAHQLLEHACRIGFSGIGIKQAGLTAGRFIHLDDLDISAHPRPRVWSY